MLQGEHCRIMIDHAKQNIIFHMDIPTENFTEDDLKQMLHYMMKFAEYRTNKKEEHE